MQKLRIIICFFRAKTFSIGFIFAKKKKRKRPNSVNQQGEEIVASFFYAFEVLKVGTSVSASANLRQRCLRFCAQKFSVPKDSND